MASFRSYESLSLGQMLEQSAAAVPDKTALVSGDRRVSYRELNDKSNHLAAGLAGLGFSKGDRVGVYMKNSIEFVISFYALQKLGVVVAWVNPMYRQRESQFILSNSQAKGVFIFREWDRYDYLQAVLAIKSEAPDLDSIITVGDGTGESVHSFDGLIEKGRNMQLVKPDIDPKNDLAMLIYTSGTTGNPKGAMITHYQAVRAGYQYSQGTGAGADDIFIGVLPMSHSYGCGANLVQPFFLQATLVLMESFKPEKALALIEKEKVTLQLAAPTHYILELNNKNRSRYDLSSLRGGLIAGQPAPEGLITRVENEMNAYLTSFWGASETGPGVGIMCPYPCSLDVREKTIGLPVPDTQLKVVDPATHEELPDGETGELTVSGWHVLKGYWNNPEETQKQIVDGWLFTGDLVSKDTDGYVRIFGRMKDLINRGGYKIYPYEVESLILEHPKVLEACVVATPNPVLGENICACIVPVADESITLDEIREFMSGNISPHKLPDELCVMAEFPRLSGGVKLKKFGQGGVTELAQMDETRQKLRK